MRIISGGQTGADRGGLDAAIELGIEHGGSCPRGRKAEDGVIPNQYKLTQTISSGYTDRTRLNIVDSDITLIFLGFQVPLNGGSKLTASICVQARKPHMVIDTGQPLDRTIQEIAGFIKAHNPNIINIAGNRESKAHGLQAKVRTILVNALQWEGDA